MIDCVHTLNTAEGQKILTQTPVEFLEQVWKPQGSGFAFIPYKDPDGGWHETSLKYPTESIAIPPKGDVYFCPNLFKDAERRINQIQRSCWLYADLDEIDPREVTPKPTLAWESSSDRYQALWRLRKRVRPEVLNDLNKRLTYLIGADKGGWDLTQVLRVPGTYNYKYDDPELVTLLWDDGPAHEISKIRKLVKEVDPSPTGLDVAELNIPEATAAEIFAKHRNLIDRRAKRILRTKRVVEGERSDRLWELENLLLESGISPEEIFVLIRESAWNKYRGRADEIYRIWIEIQKAARTQVSLQVEGDAASRVQQVAPTGWEHHDLFMETELDPPSWMVEGIWSAHSHGIIAGEPKGYKSLIATDLAISVASGTKFLGHYETHVTGSVLIIQEENSSWLMQSRIRKIEHARGILGEAHVDGKALTVKRGGDVHVELLNQSGFDLTDPSHLEALEHKVQVVRPVLVILDPLYMMLGDADENSVRDMRPILQWLLHLKVRYSTGIVLVHHYSKQGVTPRYGGQRMRGSGALHGWVESALYIEKPDPENPFFIRVNREHREQPPQGPVDLEIFTGDPADDADFEVIVYDDTPRMSQAPKEKALWKYVKKHPGVTVPSLAKRLGKQGVQIERKAKKAGLEIRKARPKKGRKGRPPRTLWVPQKRSEN